MKTRKLLAIVLAIAVIASFISVPVFAEGEGHSLETLGILTGTDEAGVTDAYLATTATRAQAALVNLRLIGQATAALAFDGTETFTDAADATAYWQPILEYLKATPAVGWNGYADGSFKPNAPVSGQAFTKVLLVALGYVEGTDFTWDTVMDFAATKGLTALAGKADTDLIVEDLAVALVEALGTKTNSATDVTLLSQLVIDGVIDKADAVAAGFEVEEAAFVIVSAYASAVDKVTVEMSTDVPDGTVVTLKKGTASYNVTKTVDGKVITLSALFNLPAGTYTVTVGEKSANFDVVKQHATDLVIGAESVYLAAGQDLKVSLLDQYGDKMSLTGTNYSVFNQSDGYVYSPAVSKTMKIDVTDDTVGKGVKAGHVIYVFVYDPVSMLTVSGELPVIAAPYLKTLEVGGITTYGKIGTKVQTDLFEGTQDSVLDVKAFDQYGKEMKLVPGMFTTNVPYDYTAQVQVLSSNSTVIDPTSINITSKGKFTFDAAAAGTVVLTFVIPDQANIYTTEALTVLGTPALKTIEIAGPTEAVYATEAAKFAISGFDQYGKAMDVSAATGITFTYTKNIFNAAPAWAKKNEGTFTVNDSTASQSSTVYYFLNGVFQGTFDVTANATAYPFQIIGIKAPGGLEEGVADTIISGDVEVIDQFGRSYKTRKVEPFTGGYDFVVVSKAALTKFTLVDNGSGSFTVTALTPNKDTGAETFIAKITKGGVVSDVSAYTFTYTLVESEDINGFAITPFANPMFIGMTSASYTVFGGTQTDYNKTVTITGKYGEITVALKYAPNGLPTIIDVVTSTNDAVEVNGNILTAASGVSKPGATSTVKAWRDGAVVASLEMELSAAKPDIVTVTPKGKNKGTWNTYGANFTYVDQYGVGKGVFSYTAINNSRSAMDPNKYFFESNWDVKGVRNFNLVKWDGSITATYLHTVPTP